MERADGASAQGSGASVDLAAVLGPPMTDPVARAAFLADPGTHLTAAGFSIPSWLTVTAVEREEPGLTIALAPILDEGAIAEIFLNSANGGSADTPAWL